MGSGQVQGPWSSVQEGQSSARGRKRGAWHRRNGRIPNRQLNRQLTPTRPETKTLIATVLTTRTHRYRSNSEEAQNAAWVVVVGSRPVLSGVCPNTQHQRQRPKPSTHAQRGLVCVWRCLFSICIPSIGYRAIVPRAASPLWGIGPGQLEAKMHSDILPASTIVPAGNS